MCALTCRLISQTRAVIGASLSRSVRIDVVVNCNSTVCTVISDINADEMITEMSMVLHSSDSLVCLDHVLGLTVSS